MKTWHANLWQYKNFDLWNKIHSKLILVSQMAERNVVNPYGVTSHPVRSTGDEFWEPPGWALRRQEYWHVNHVKRHPLDWPAMIRCVALDTHQKTRIQKHVEITANCLAIPSDDSRVKKKAVNDLSPKKTKINHTIWWQSWENDKMKINGLSRKNKQKKQ